MAFVGANCESVIVAVVQNKYLAPMSFFFPVTQHFFPHVFFGVLWSVVVDRKQGSVLQCFAVCCSVLQCAAVCCSALQTHRACCG